MATTNKKFNVKNGLSVGGASGITDVINEQGQWVGATGTLHGATGATGPQGASGVAGATGPAGSGTGGGWSVVTGSTGATSGSNYIANTTGGSFTISLPSSPSAGNYVSIQDGGNWNTTPLTIDRNGSTIEGFSDNLELNVGQSLVTLIYDGTTWQLSSTGGPIGSTGFTGATGVWSNWTRVTSSTLAVKNNQYIADSTGGTFAITLPSTPTTGDYVVIQDGGNWSTTPVTVQRNGSTIEGTTDDLELNVGGSLVTLIYDGTTWQLASTAGPIGATGVPGVGGATGPAGATGPGTVLAYFNYISAL